MIHVGLLDDNEIAIYQDTANPELEKIIDSWLQSFGVQYDKSLQCYIGQIGDLQLGIIEKLSELGEVQVHEDIDLDNIDSIIAQFDYVTKRDLPFYNRLLMFPPRTKDQERGIKDLISKEATMLDGDVGVGKTYISISAINHLERMNITDHVLVITHPIALRNWRKEFLMFGKNYEEDDFYIVDSVKARTPFQSGKKVIIMAFQHAIILVRDKYKEKKKELTKRSHIVNKNPLKSDILTWSDKFTCILDESHLIKNPRTLTYKCIVPMLSEIATQRFAMTGTFKPNKWVDAYSQMQFVSKKLVGNMSYEQFVRDTCVVGSPFSDKEDYNLDIVSIIPEKKEKWEKVWKPYITRIEKKDEVEVRTKKVLVDISNIHREVYQSLVSDTLFKIREHSGGIDFVKVVNSFPYLLLALADPVMLEKQDFYNQISGIKSWDITKNEKLKISKYIVEEKYALGEKTIIWLENPKVIEALVPHFKKYNPLIVHGQQKVPKGLTKTEFRDLIIDKINNENSEHRLLIANPATVGIAQNIVGANNEILWRGDFNFGRITQARGRINRIGQKRDINSYFLIAENTIDELAFYAYEHKASLNDIKIKFRTLTKEQYRLLFEGKFNLWEIGV